MSVHVGPTHSFNKGGKAKFEKMGWKFRFNVIGRRVIAEKYVDGKLVKSLKMCCLNRLLIQIQAWEAGIR
ncbi:MAG: hypothetical protein MUC88_20690 [Planctomycetes bacterium]|jgi:hypothetical protein|nr:hypothetical protein [Planctomycetota bacterium]